MLPVESPLSLFARIKRFIKITLLVFLVLLLVVSVVAGVLIYRESESSEYQSQYLAELGKKLRFEVKPGANKDIRIPQAGPYDHRMGYSQLPGWTPRLLEQNFEIAAQARISPDMQDLVDRGLFLPYREKSQAGLSIIDPDGQSLSSGVFPVRLYRKLDEVSGLVAQTLTFIENRELLDMRFPNKNPAVDWGRFALAVMDKGIQTIKPEHDVPGGSTLATQIEKYRHSPNGLTLSAHDKLQQMASASVRAYLGGENTVEARQNILLTYLNTVPLSAYANFGEVNGLGDGLWAWFGMDFEQTNKILHDGSNGKGKLEDTARAYRHVLSLFIAQRRPSGYLINERAALEELTDSHLRMLASEKVISPELRDAALKARLQFRNGLIKEESDPFSKRKAANAVRVKLASLLGMKRLYELDRLDLSVKTTLNHDLQQQVTDILRAMKIPSSARAAGLYGERLLGEADPGKVIYSFTLHELTPEGAKMRIQADNYDQPFDINQGTKLDLGSTAKLRTLVSYLVIIEKLHEEYAQRTQEELDKDREEIDQGDPLTLWALDYLRQNEDHSLAAMLDAALDRQYSANPGEGFFTGGGLQYFHNFKKEDDGRTMNLREATRNSVNLVFIRLMRDIKRYYMFHIPGSSANILKDPKDPSRKEYLKKFADKEGKEFLSQFWQKYRKLSPEQVSDTFFSVFKTPRRIGAAFRYVNPKASQEQFEAFIESKNPGFKSAGASTVAAMYREFEPGRWSLADQSYIAHIHPLDLWLAGYLINNPGADFKQAVEASSAERVEIYGWLINTNKKNAQDSRIRNLLEVEAFMAIHRDWKRVGYPFEHLVPSLATAIGSSADRPAALAELMGIILNNGERLPATSIEQLHFASGTPFETLFKQKLPVPERIFSPELASVVRGVLINVVEHGTAGRLRHAVVQEDKTWIAIGGKTGTGDHRYITFASAGVIKSSRAVNRSATFAFFLGDRFYGTLTAFVPGAAAADYHFTSAVSAQLLKHLLPTLKPLTDTARPLPEQDQAPRKETGRVKPPQRDEDESVDSTVLENGEPKEVPEKVENKASAEKTLGD